MDGIPRTGYSNKSSKSRDERIAEGLYNAQVLREVARLMRQGCSVEDVRRILQLGPKTAQRFWDWALERARMQDPHPDQTKVIMGEVLLAPDERQLREDCFELRKRAIPVKEIADTLGITTEQVNRYVKTQLILLQAEETADVDLARAMQVAQVDSMIRAIFPRAIGEKAPLPDYDAIDRMMKLLQHKSKLLGLDAPEMVDIRQRIDILVEEQGYDPQEIKEIVAEVTERARSRALR